MKRRWSSLSQTFFGFAPLIIIPPLRHTHLSPSPELCDSPDHAAHYHILGWMQSEKVGFSFKIRSSSQPMEQSPA
jgi:hypothetical protein